MGGMDRKAYLQVARRVMSSTVMLKAPRTGVLAMARDYSSSAAGAHVYPQLVELPVRFNATRPSTYTGGFGVIDRTRLFKHNYAEMSQLPLDAVEADASYEAFIHENHLNYITMAFPFAGGWNAEKHAVKLTNPDVFDGKEARCIPVEVYGVINQLIGSGKSFSQGGPGKGMFSRCFTQVLNKHQWVDSCRSFASYHEGSGLLGITMGVYNGVDMADPTVFKARQNFTRDGLAVLEAVLNDVYKYKLEDEQGGKDTELMRAKHRLIADLFFNLEYTLTGNEDIVRQYLLAGAHKSVETLKEKIMEVTRDDIRFAAKALLQNKNPTVLLYGHKRSISL